MTDEPKKSLPIDGAPDGAIIVIVHGHLSEEIARKNAGSTRDQGGVLAAGLALTGRWQDAQKAMARLRQLFPKARISNLRNRPVYNRPEDLARLEEGLRPAGLPE